MAEHPEDDRLEKIFADQTEDIVTPTEDSIVTEKNIHMLNAYLRVTLGKHFHDHKTDLGTIRQLLLNEEIVPHTLRIEPSTNTEISPPLQRVLTERWKEPPDTMRPRYKQKVCIHPGIEVGEATFKSVLSDIIANLEDSPRSAVESLIKNYFEEEMPSKLRIIPSVEDNPIRTQFPGYDVHTEFVTIPDPVLEANTNAHFYEHLEIAHSRISNYLADPKVSLVALGYSPLRPMIIRIHKLMFQADKVLKTQFFENFMKPKNVCVQDPPEHCEEVLDDVYGLQSYTSKFTQADIDHVRETLLRASGEYTTVYIQFRPIVGGEGAIIRIHGKR